MHTAGVNRVYIFCTVTTPYNAADDYIRLEGTCYLCKSGRL